jgi:glycine hydroxymethyltransferase
LDFVTTNYVRWLEDGQSHYSYLLDPDGNVIDDVMIYRLKKDRYIMVVNAANEEKDWAWLNAVNSRRVIVDREYPDKEVDGQAILRNLKDPSSGKDMKVDMALQGPASIHILMALADRDGREILKRLRRTELAELTLDGMDVIVARTGYTGEEWGYEIFVHPEDAPRLWNLLLEKGQPFGIKPAGLGARDSTRTEAGLPLYGHELAGPFNIDPIEAGFAPYVKFHKPYFIGRKAIIEKEAKRTREIIRFRMNRKGVPRPEPGDRVINQRGDYIGVVTSCAIDTEGYLVGMALIDKRYAQEGAQIGIFAGRFRQKEIKPIDKLGPGDSVPLPEWATILPRFMRRS